MRKMQTSSTFLGLLLELRLSVSPPPPPITWKGLVMHYVKDSEDNKHESIDVPRPRDACMGWGWGVQCPYLPSSGKKVWCLSPKMWS